jgi:membrane protein implicated in regulation of membrane protease activity
MLVLVLLGIVWLVVLAPMVVRKLREREVVSSVTSFNRQLLHLSGGSPGRGAEASLPAATIGYSAAAQRLSDRRVAAGLGDSGAIGFGPRFGQPRALLAADIGPLVSHATTIRRRRVVALLVLGTLVTFALGFGLALFFYLAIAGVAAIVMYFALLAYFHQLALERAQKVVALETRRGAAQALDEARIQQGAVPGTLRPRVGGSGWSVPEEELEGLDLERGDLISVTAAR